MKKYSLFLLFAVLFSYGCGKDAVKPSEDSQFTSEALNRIEVIRTAYQIKDTGILKLEMAAQLADSVLKNISFEKADLSFTPRMVRITDEYITVAVIWQGKWQLEKGEKLENRGVADLLLQRETMKLIRVEGDNPFMLPVVENR